MKQIYKSITVSAPGKIHLLGEHAVVYGKPAILTTVDLRVTVTITPSLPVIVRNPNSIGTTKQSIKKIIEPIIKKHLKINKLPSYQFQIESQAPIGAGLGSSAAISAAYIASLLCFLKIKWDLNLVYKLTYEAEKVFHGNPSGGDPATVIFGGLVWYRKETPDLKVIHPFPFSIPKSLAKNFMIINTGTPKESTKEMVSSVKNLYDKNPKLVERFLDSQEKLVKELLLILKEGKEKELIRIIREGEKNLESIGACSTSVKKIIRQIEFSGGAAKICGAGGFEGPTGVVLGYHPDKNKLLEVIKSLKLPYFITKLGVEGLRIE